MITSRAEEPILLPHRTLDTIYRQARGKHFISGWQTTHPHVRRYLAGAQCFDGVDEDLARYTMLCDWTELVDAIRMFHGSVDQVDYARDEVYVSSGSSALLFGFLLYLRERGVTDIYYTLPLYYANFYFCQSLGLRLHCVSDEMPHHDSCHLDLPRESSVLVLTDPLWIIGAPVHESHIEHISKWQRETSSTVLVDGTFQYIRWAGSAREASAGLDRDRTFRLVCPTKSTGIHGVRFAYLLLPAAMRDDIHHACSTMVGATGWANDRYALELMRVLNGATRNREMVDHTRDMHRLLLENAVIHDEVVAPSTGYFTFARVDERIAKQAILMDQSYFAISGLDGLARVNLLYPDWASLIGNAR